MIELPEAHVLANEVDDALSGKVVTRVVAASSPHKFAWYHEDPVSYPNLLEQKELTKSFPQGGFVRIEFSDNINLVLSEGIRLRFHHEGTLPPPKHQLFVEFTDKTFLVGSVQMYGGLCAFRNNEYDNEYYRAAREKPSPLSKVFNRMYFSDLLQSVPENRSLKAFLATEQRIPGLGNGVLQDILFNARLHPKKKIGTLNSEARDALFDAVKFTLKKMADEGGRNTEQDLFGHAGNYQTLLCKNTVGNPCTVCGSAIEKQAYMGGSIYFCPGCQEL